MLNEESIQKYHKLIRRTIFNDYYAKATSAKKDVSALKTSKTLDGEMLEIMLCNVENKYNDIRDSITRARTIRDLFDDDKTIYVFETGNQYYGYLVVIAIIARLENLNTENSNNWATLKKIILTFDNCSMLSRHTTVDSGDFLEYVNAMTETDIQKRKDYIAELVKFKNYLMTSGIETVNALKILF